MSQLEAAVRKVDGVAEMHEGQTALCGDYDDFGTENQFISCPIVGGR